MPQKAGTRPSKTRPRSTVKPRGRFAALAVRQQRAKQFCEIYRQILPEPKCELYYETPFQLLVSVVLSAQTTDKMVNRCMEPLYKQGLTPHDILRMGESRFKEKIRSIGLAPTKAKNVLALSRIIHQQFADSVPNSREDLEALPGVGRKTANVILGEIFRHPTLAVDTHVFRVGYRLGFHGEKTPEKAERELLKVLPDPCLPDAHHWLILHGRYTCKALNPDCEHCPVSHICPSGPTAILHR